MVFLGGLGMAGKKIEAEGRIQIRKWEAQVDGEEVLCLDASIDLPEAEWPTSSGYPGVWAYLDSDGDWLLVGHSRTNVWKAGFNPFLCKRGVCCLPTGTLDRINPTKAEIMTKAAVFRYWLCESAGHPLELKKTLCLKYGPLLNRPPDSTARKAPWN